MDLDWCLSLTYVNSSDSEICLNEDLFVDSDIHFYHLKRFGPESQQLSPEDDSSAYKIWDLPCFDFDQQWENLIFDDNIKNDVS